MSALAAPTDRHHHSITSRVVERRWRRVMNITKVGNTRIIRPQFERLSARATHLHCVPSAQSSTDSSKVLTQGRPCSPQTRNVEGGSSIKHHPPHRPIIPPSGPSTTDSHSRGPPTPSYSLLTLTGALSAPAPCPRPFLLEPADKACLARTSSPTTIISTHMTRTEATSSCHPAPQGPRSPWVLPHHPILSHTVDPP